MDIYLYDGPVKEFDRCICNKWHGETYAISRKKALNNLTYQFKKETGREPRTRISLPGKLISIDEKDR